MGLIQKFISNIFRKKFMCLPKSLDKIRLKIETLKYEIDKSI